MKMTPHRLKSADALFIDIDGTAVNSEPVIREVIEELAAAAGYTFKPKDWDILAGIGDREVGKKLAEWSPEFAKQYPTGEAFEVARLRRYVERIGEVRANQPVLDLVKQYVAAGKHVVAVTNSPIDLATDHLTITGYPIQDIDLISQEDAYNRRLEPKPSPALYDLAFYKTGLSMLDQGICGKLKRKNCLVLEDSATGVRGGLRAGMMTIQFTDMCKVLDADEAKSISSRKASFHPMTFDEMNRMLVRESVPA